VVTYVYLHPGSEEAKAVRYDLLFFFFFSHSRLIYVVGGYKWLKYVPNSILKTAQAAEWKIQAWMIGKPPTIAYEGIGYTAPTVLKSANKTRTPSPLPSGSLGVSPPANGDARPRPSIGSSTFSEYDDLGDFDGRFESRSTLGTKSRPSGQYSLNTQESGRLHAGKRKTSRGILDRLKGSSTSPQQSQEQQPSTSRKLKVLRSMGSLKAKGQHPKSEPPSPQLPPALRIDIGLGLEDLSWTKSIQPDVLRSDLSTATPHVYASGSMGSHSRSGGRRSISFTSSKTPLSMPGSPVPSTCTTSFVQNGHTSHQMALGNALIAASHAESAKGTHSDLLQILNHENHSWGFSYASYPHNVRVWYGDRDEKIAENAVRWMERTMGPEHCSVKVVKGADHGLMYRSSAVVDVLEWILTSWRTEDNRHRPYSGLR